MSNRGIYLCCASALLCLSGCAGFSAPVSTSVSAIGLKKQISEAVPKDKSVDFSVTSSMGKTRKAFLASIISTAAGVTAFANSAHADDEGFASIAAKAASIAKTVEAVEDATDALEEARTRSSNDPRTAYEFSLPISGLDVSFEELVKQEFTMVEGPPAGENEEVTAKKEAKVKAILVVNIKQDDPLARKNIPELISLASK